MANIFKTSSKVAKNNGQNKYSLDLSRKWSNAQKMFLNFPQFGQKPILHKR